VCERTRQNATHVAPLVLTAALASSCVSYPSQVWTEPPGQGAAVAAYTVEVSSDRGRSFRFAAETSETAHTLTGLTAGTLYGFRVRAENQARSLSLLLTRVCARRTNGATLTLPLPSP
jgi:hypothetical protein